MRFVLSGLLPYRLNFGGSLNTILKTLIGAIVLSAEPVKYNIAGLDIIGGAKFTRLETMKNASAIHTLNIMIDLKTCYRCQLPKRIWACNDGNKYCKSCYMIAFPKVYLKGKAGLKAIVKAEKKESIPELKKKLDKVFSLFIRLRNADNNGMVVCFTSGKKMHYKEAHAGHFISRRHLGTRWDEINVQVQSVGENLFNQGNAPVFGKNIIEQYGMKEYEKLFIKKDTLSKYGKFELKQFINHYQQEVENLLKKLSS